MTVPLALAELAPYVAEMRRLGVTRAGDIELGPDPNARPDEAGETQRTADAEYRERERKRRIVTGASGGPRPRAAQ